MRKLPWLLAGALLPVAALAGGETYHDLDGTFVSADAKAKTVTVKLEGGATSTDAVDDATLKAVSGLKAGDPVVITCKDNEKGEHVAVSAVKPAKKKS